MKIATTLEENMKEIVEGSNGGEGKHHRRDHGVNKKTYALIPLTGWGLNNSMH